MGKNGVFATQTARLGGFAVGHLALSVITAALHLLLSGIFLQLGAWSSDRGEGWGEALELATGVLPFLCVALYFPLGMAVATLKGWERPRSWREGVLSVLWPTLIAWAWAALVAATVSLDGAAAENQVFGVLLAEVCISWIFAAPSAALVFFAVSRGLAGVLVPGLLFWGFWAGLVPPLLFTLGSLFPMRGAEKKRAG